MSMPWWKACSTFMPFERSHPMNVSSLLRMVSLGGLLVAVLCLAGCGSQEAPPAVALPPKIPITDFFDNPKISSAHISPDGTRLAFLAPENGKLNVWVCPLNEGPAKARV